MRTFPRPRAEKTSALPQLVVDARGDAPRAKEAQQPG